MKHRDPFDDDKLSIIIENGKVSAVYYVSSNGYWDRELKESEYIVEYHSPQE